MPDHTPADNGTIIRLRDVRYRWPGDGSDILHIPDLSIARGNRVFLTGPSGSGKTTLLNLLSGVVLPRTGRIDIQETEVSALNDATRDRFRVDHIGFVFQMFNLMPYLSTIDNVLLPCRFSTVRRTRATSDGRTLQEEAERLLTAMSLDAQSVRKQKVSTLSVGQQQRVAAARALIGRPEILIADEPTSALDIRAAADFFDLLTQEASASGATILVVSHDTRLAENFDQTIDITDFGTRP